MLQKGHFFCLVILSLTLGLPRTECQAQELGTGPAVLKPPAQIPVVLSTDCGADMDDQWALAHLLLSPEFGLQAVITSHASSINLSSATAAKIASDVVAYVLPLGLRSGPPVLPGSESPLRNANTPRENAGVNLLLRLSRGFCTTRRLNVFVTGAGTDVASAILKDASIVHRISVVAMGFNDWPGGGDVFNVKNDPLAWQIILDSEVPIVIASSAVTKRHLRLTRAEAAALMGPHGPLGEYLYSLFDNWLKTQAAIVNQFVGPDTWVVWDEGVVAYALGMARGNQVPRPKLQPDLSFSHQKTNQRITWLTGIDAPRFWHDFTRKIDAQRRQKIAR
jgi:purine nucleosidase